MRSRIAERLGLEIRVSTFHALGLEIVARVAGVKPSLPSWTDSERQRNEHIQTLLGETMRDPSTADAVRRYIQSHFAPYRSPFELVTEGDYFDYLASVEMVSLNGETVKSFEEAEIANFLCLNGIRYQYEAHYAHPTADAERRQYQPDFYLPDANLYIEHFGIARDGSTAPYVDRTRYSADIEWKRDPSPVRYPPDRDLQLRKARRHFARGAGRAVARQGESPRPPRSPGRRLPGSVRSAPRPL